MESRTTTHREIRKVKEDIENGKGSKWPRIN